jgi:hypothetical protein
MAKTTRSRSRRSKRKPSGKPRRSRSRSKRKPSGKPRRSHSRSKRRTQTRRDGRDQYDDGGWGNPDLDGQGDEDFISIDLNEKQGYLNSYPQHWDRAKKDKFTKRFEQLAGPDPPLDGQGRRWVTEEMVKLWWAHMNVRDWNWWGQRYESVAVKKEYRRY